LLVTLTLLAAGPPVASAQSGLNLFWDHCAADGGKTVTLFDCSSNAGMAVALASVAIPADMPQFAAAQVIIDVHVADGTIPPWWQVAAGQCRENRLTASYDPTGFPWSENCPAIWGEVVPLQVQTIQPGISGPGIFRALSAAAVPAGSERSLVADGTELTVCRVVVLHGKTVGQDACAGCRVGACFWLKEIYLQQPAGLPNQRIIGTSRNTIIGHNAIGEFYTVFQPSDVQCTTPALNRTWGAIKALYR